ncbi:MAG TPA: YraN family protein [Candidatus Uhrbacteria bacterium]|nr:YraN family protein [Candidatus Uhrbacteria bacterium]
MPEKNKNKGRLKEIGDFGQQIAKRYLLNKNYKILGENYYCREGEIDLIAQKGSQIVFLEVKTRLSRNFGLPEEAVGKEKKEKMEKAALAYLEKEKVKNENYRFDLMAVEIDKQDQKARIRHHKAI